jgi:hypothetical protein
MEDRPQQATEPEAQEDSPRSLQIQLQPPSYTDAPSVYSNFMQASLTQHDLTLYFGWYATPVPPDPPPERLEVPVRPLMAVSIPHGIVRGLISVLE